MNIFKCKVIVCDLKVVSKIISIELVKIQKKKILRVKYIVFRNEVNKGKCDRTCIAFKSTRPVSGHQESKMDNLNHFLTL